MIIGMEEFEGLGIIDVLEYEMGFMWGNDRDGVGRGMNGWV